ncbi:3-methyladenine DNA glycosylase AlkD [Lachnospiraceae bacterium XBB1006]|nr:3-methyladenine DNA glycosylase AlkD [Lachnospiraceae bacterium XBB1006]
MEIVERIQRELFEKQDLQYQAFQRKIIPGINPECIIGVRTPILRAMAKNLEKKEGGDVFLTALPHSYFEENQLHAFIIASRKDYVVCIKEVQAFLPYVNNWATCDQLSPAIFKKYRKELLPYIQQWIGNEHPYTVRFGIKMLMDHFLEEAFEVDYPEMVAKIRSKEYYVNMMIAWYFATALAKQYEHILPFLEERRLDDWTHNKAIQKAVESDRITKEQKTHLKTLKVKNNSKM